MSRSINILAIDLGAESGRHVLCRWDGRQGKLRDVHRFPNRVRRVNEHLLWDVDYLWEEILEGIRKAVESSSGQVDAIGIDGWAVDYVLLDSEGRRIGDSFCYRDSRNPPQMHKALSILPREQIYQITGIQFLPFNTIYQLMAHREEFPADWREASLWLNLPEYFLYRLSETAVSEYTNATHTQMLDVSTRKWSEKITDVFELDVDKFPHLVDPGSVLGRVRPELVESTGLSETRVIAPACHDTGSAVAGIPFPQENLAFISSGTWSLVGTVLPQPVVNNEAMEANFTNEGGVGQSVRFLKNVIGLWLLQQCLQEWSAAGHKLDAAHLAMHCEGMPAQGPYFDADSERFLAGGNMVSRINKALQEQGFLEEKRPLQLSKIIFRSLARKYAEVIDTVQSISGKRLEAICIVGGGVKNEVLNQLTHDFTGLKVLRGPSESSIVGNVAVQISAMEKANSLEEIQEISRSVSC